jgi:hypothetical protein
VHRHNGNSGFGELVGIKFKLDFHCRGQEEANNLDNLGMKKSKIGGKQYLDYLWELGELLVYTIGGFGVSVSLRYNCPYIVKIRGSVTAKIEYCVKPILRTCLYIK